MPFQRAKAALDLGPFLVIEHRGLGEYFLFRDTRANDVNPVERRRDVDLGLVDLECEYRICDYQDDVLGHLVFADDFPEAHANPVDAAPPASFDPRLDPVQLGRGRGDQFPALFRAAVMAEPC